MSLNPADSLPQFQLINVGFYSGAGAPGSLVSSTLVALYFNTSGGSSTSVYVTLNHGTTWAAITSA